MNRSLIFRSEFQLSILLTLLTLHMIRFSMVLPFVSLMAAEMGASTVAIGIVGGSYFCLALFFGIPLGHIVDRFGMRMVLIGGGLLGVAQAILLLSANSIVLLVVAQLIGGISHQAFIVATAAYSSHLSSVQEREKGFGYQSFFVSLGLSVGPLLGGFLVQKYGHQANFLGALFLSFPALSIIVLPIGRNLRVIPKGPPSTGLREVVGLLRDPKIRAVLVLAFFVMIVISLRNTFLPVFLRTQMFSNAQVGILIAAISVISMIVRFYGGYIMGRFSRRGVAIYSALAIVVSIGIIPFFSQIHYLLPILLYYGTGFALTQPLTMVMVSDQAPSQNAGLSMGLRFTVVTLANVVGPIILGLIGAKFGLHATFYSASCMLALVSFYILVLNPDLLPQRHNI
jgi:MFS family permease